MHLSDTIGAFIKWDLEYILNINPTDFIYQNLE
jgi:hypothetical protein